MSAYRQAHATCAHHAGVVSARTCRKCDEALCEPCCAFVVNDDIWCADCGEELQGDGRLGQIAGRMSVLVALVLVAAFAATAHVRWGRLGLTFASLFLVVAATFLAQLFRLQRMRYGPRILHSPRIHRRKAGDALPRIPSWAQAPGAPSSVSGATTPASASARGGRPPA